MTRGNVQYQLEGGEFESPLMIGEDNLSKEYIPFLHLLRLEAGGEIPAWADGSADGFDQMGNEEGALVWNTGANPTDLACNILLPDWLDSDEDITLCLLGAPSGTDDSPVFTVEAYFNAAGAEFGADADAGGETSEFAATTEIEEATLTIDSDDIPDGPCVLTLVLHPKDGELGTDDFYLYMAWLEVMRKV